MALGALALLLSPPAVVSQERSLPGVDLADLTWIEAEPLLTPDAVVVIPLGAASKEHGPHLRLDNDFVMAEYLKQRVMEASNVVIAPTVAYHFYPAFLEYPGSTHLSFDTSRDLVVDIVRSLAGYGPRKFYVLNTGVSTLRPLSASAEVLAEEGIVLQYTNILDVAAAEEDQVREQERGTHADEIETSMMLYIAPDRVEMSKAVREDNPRASGGLTRVEGGEGVYSESGVWGDATLATVEKGRIIVEATVRGVLEDIEALRAMDVVGSIGERDAAQPTTDRTAAPYVVVLGIAQDGGVPQAGSKEHPAWENPHLRRLAASLGLVAPARGRRWLFEATPDFREQLHRLDEIAPVDDAPGLAGVFLTHAHIGHYTGLMFLGHESLGAQGVPVYAMPRMADFLAANGPWSQLVRYENILLNRLEDGVTVPLGSGLTVTPFLVPHRQEYAEVVGFRIEGPNRSVLFIPDIDSWEEWDESGTRIEAAIASVDVAYVDGTFFANGEIPGRDMTGFPHPFITHSIQRFAELPPAEKAKIRFIHLNHTNQALLPDSEARKTIEQSGFRVAEEGEQVEL